MANNSLKSKQPRRTYSKQFKAELVAQHLEGHTSLTSLAVTPPSANLMQPAQRPYLIDNPDGVAPEEALEVGILNLGILKDIANRLHLLQEWARMQVNVP